MNRRGFLKGLAGIVAAPAIVRAESLMKLWTPRSDLLISQVHMFIGPEGLSVERVWMGVDWASSTHISGDCVQTAIIRSARSTDADDVLFKMCALTGDMIFRGSISVDSVIATIEERKEWTTNTNEMRTALVDLS